MSKIYCIIIFVFFNFKSTSARANNSFVDCELIASKFNSTTNVSCYGLTNATCPVDVINGECKFEHISSATCINGTAVEIQIYSNGLPPFCPNRNNTYRLVEQNINFTVIFNPDVSVNQPQLNAVTQADLHAIVCSPNSTQLTSNNATLMLSDNTTIADRIVGISIDGVAILNALDGYNEDVFYPINSTSTESVDQCLGRVEADETYYYHLGSSCPLDPPNDLTTTCSNIPVCQPSIPNYSTSMFISHKHLTVIGIAKDGHLIYGPYRSDGTLITDGFDICNGMFFDSVGNYGYFVTNTFPYVIGCFGPSNYPQNLQPNCTKNPPVHYIKSSYAEALSKNGSGSLGVTFSFIFILTTMILMLINSY
jgi:hypothetical protein